MEDEFRWMLAQETPRLRRFAIALTGSPDRGDDLVQDALERALRKRRLWRDTRSLRSWLFKLLYRVHLNQVDRRQTERQALAALETGDGMPPNQDGHVEVLNIAAALQALPVDQREAVLLVGLEGLAYDEAADVLGVPMGTLKSRLFRGREALWALRNGEATTKLRSVKG